MVYENEITVEVDCGIEELHKILKTNNFQLKEEYDLIDFYLIKKDYVNNSNALEVLKQCVLLRNIVKKNKKINLITYKYKEYNASGEIIKQGKINCKIESIEKAQTIFEALGYVKLIEIRDHISVFTKEVTELAVQEVNDKHIYIELEDSYDYVDKGYSNIEEMKKELHKYNIPIKGSDYFVKKAVIELNEQNI